MCVREGNSLVWSYKQSLCLSQVELECRKARSWQTITLLPAGWGERQNKRQEEEDETEARGTQLKEKSEDDDARQLLPSLFCCRIRLRILLWSLHFASRARCHTQTEFSCTLPPGFGKKRLVYSAVDWTKQSESWLLWSLWKEQSTGLTTGLLVDMIPPVFSFISYLWGGADGDPGFSPHSESYERLAVLRLMFSLPTKNKNTEGKTDVKNLCLRARKGIVNRAPPPARLQVQSFLFNCVKWACLHHGRGKSSSPVCQCSVSASPSPSPFSPHSAWQLECCDLHQIDSLSDTFAQTPPQNSHRHPPVKWQIPKSKSDTVKAFYRVNDEGTDIWLEGCVQEPRSSLTAQ